MPKNKRSELAALYKSSDIDFVWKEGQSSKLIKHPQYGLISPNKYRAVSQGKPCPFCGKHMVHGQISHSTLSKDEAIERGYQYINGLGEKFINHVGSRYFHPHYVTLDHKVNKARCPELMFEYDNLQIMCWKCNINKGDNNAYELEHSFGFVKDLGKDALQRYPLL